MPVPEIANAMYTGGIDGVVSGATTLQAFRLAEVMGFIATGVVLILSSLFLIMIGASSGELSQQ